jgi:ABC-type lipoprotein release transport system permease subunit
MSALRFILTSARHYWRTHLGVVLGAALATLVLTGSLLVGDSVKATLRRQALDRAGKVSVAMTVGDRFFRDALAAAVNADAAPVLMLRATVARADGQARVNVAQVLGVDERFWKLSPSGAVVDLPDDGVALNARLAQQLGVAPGDTVIVRVEKPGMFSKDAPLSGEENEVVAMRAPVGRIVSDAEFGRFSLSASQVPPFTVCVPLPFLQERLQPVGRSNLLLFGPMGFPIYRNGLEVGRQMGTSPWKTGSQSHESLGTGLGMLVQSKWNLMDAGVELRDLPVGGLELRTSRVFLDSPVVAAAPRGKDDRRVDSLTYFVNELRSGGKATPYSIVTAVETASSGFLPAELADDEIVITQWLADDLRIGTGAKVTVKYLTMGERRQLEEKAREFAVLAVLPMNEPQLNDSWMPDFPGLKDAKNCRDWKPGFEIDMTKMRAKDNDYWEQHRGTPKAFVNLKVGQEMWGNRWGHTTALRWLAGTDRAEIEKALREKVTPEMLGFQFIPLREQALAATRAPVDFGQLFVSFSFFLIAAAAVLTGLLFVFTLEQRAAESGTLLALGLPQRLVRRMLLTEGAVLALVGSVLGAAGAVIYTRLVLRGLATVWRGAVGAVEFQFSAAPWTIPIGVVSGVVIAVLAMWLASRRQLRHSVTELLTNTESSAPRKSRRPWTAAVPPQLSDGARHPQSGEGITAVQGLQLHFPIATALAAVVLAITVPFLFPGAGSFFGAGALLLVAGLLSAMAALRKTANGTELGNLAQLGVRNAARRRGRSLATIAVLASGVFMVVAVDSFRHGPQVETAKLDSGTGGFALVGESASPIYEDLNSAKGREAYALDDAAMKDVRVAPMRVRDGDDASCLNLNRALQPRLLGVRPEDLDAPATRFRLRNFASWSAALADRRDGAVPGIVDANTLQWAMQKKVGDAIEYRDDRGQTFRVVVVGTVAGSMLQGNVLIAERHFIERFPNAGGYRFFLIDAPAERAAAVSQELSRALQDRGLEVTPAARRLAEFNAVENTYLSIFQVLGGLGLLLGSAGLAIVVARNVLERRREFGLLEAVGFRANQLRALVFAEHRWLIVAALAIGTVSALVAVWPQLAEKAGGFPLREVALLLAALALGCIFWTWIATRTALRGSGVSALRSE